MPREKAILVRIDADAELAGVGRRLQHALPGRAGGGVDDVGAAVDLRLGEFAALDRIVPGRGRRAGHVGEHFVLAVGSVFDALRISALEFRDQRDVHAADEADLAGLGCLRRDDADDERAFLLLEHDRLDIRQVDHVVDDAEVGLGIFRGDFLQRGLPGEADGHDRREAVLGELAQDLLPLRLVLDLEIAELDAGLLREPRCAVEHALVERFVELAAKIIENRGLDSVGCIGRDGSEKTSGENRRRHERDASEHILTSHWRERLPSPQRELTGWPSKSARNLTVKRDQSVPADERRRDYAGDLPRASAKPGSVVARKGRSPARLRSREICEPAPEAQHHQRPARASGR